MLSLPMLQKMRTFALRRTPRVCLNHHLIKRSWVQLMDLISYLSRSHKRDGIISAEILPSGTKENRKKMRQNEGRLVDFIDCTEPNHRPNMQYSPRKDKNDPEGDFKIIRASLSVSESQAIASISIGQMAFNQSCRGWVTLQGFGSSASQSLGAGPKQSHGGGTAALVGLEGKRLN